MVNGRRCATIATGIDMMTFAVFSHYLERLTVITARLEITAVLAELYRSLEPVEVRSASYLLQGSLVPEYQSLDFMLSTKMIQRALTKLRTLEMTRGGVGTTTVPSPAAQEDLFGGQLEPTEDSWVENAFRQHGDLGAVAEMIIVGARKNGTSSPAHNWSLLEVYERLKSIAHAAGQGSQEEKVRQLVDLLLGVDAVSAKFIVRIILAKLRLGFSTMTIIDALSWSVHGTKQDHEVLEEAYQKQADIGRLAETYLGAASDQERAAALAAYSVRPGVPIVPQLCQRLASPAEVIAKMGAVIVEPKYDGLRAQIHVAQVNGQRKVSVFTRSLEDVTDMFPEALTVSEQLRAETVVLDGEAIGYDRNTGQLVPFQLTITRKRKHEVTLAAINVPIKFFVYDVLSLNGRSLLAEPLRERKRILRTILTDAPQVALTETITTSDPAQIQSYHEKQLSEGLEGVVIKQVDSPYQGGRKGWYWVKLKELAGTTGKLSDTIDCLVLGYYPGQGKRTAFGVGAFLVGIRDGERYLTVAKIGTGLTDDQFRELKTRCLPLETSEQPSAYRVTKSLIPSTWVQPGLIVEIAADEITTSPAHSAGSALRFPRLVRFRDDKTIEQVTTKEELENIAGKRAG